MSARAFEAPVAALVRGVPDSYSRCLRREAVAVDPALARAQVEGYARALSEHGVAVARVATDEACPDACFIEDTAVVLDASLAVISKPGAASRRPEVPPVAEALGGRFAKLVRLEQGDARATLDGGDVLRLDDLLLVGLSERTNREGAAALERVAGEVGLSVVALPLAEGLHLKSVLTLVAPGCVVALEGAPGLDVIRSRGARCIEVDEPAGANVLALGRVVLVSSAAPRTAARLEREAGVEVRTIDVTELHKGDGALTCLSLRIPRPGAWCA